jgi:hypothetical protein
VSDTRFVTLATIIGAVFVACVYVPAVGRGFVKDDFRWLGDARSALEDPVHAVLPRAPNFYRPLVTASFAANYTLFGLNARAYGLTNVALYLACIAAIWLLLRDVGVGGPAASIGALTWALNPHGINMAVVWISGRTSLMLTVFGVLSTVCFLRRWRLTGALLLLAALLSKEEATVLPFVILVWVPIARRERRVSKAGTGGGDWALDVLGVLVPLVVYFALRAQTPALTPSTAPWFYRFTADPRALAINALSYLDRGATFFVVMAAIGVAIYGRTGLRGVSPRLVVAGLAWFLGGIALTVLIPVRSSLYAVFPSVGIATITAAVFDALRAADNTRSRDDLRFAAALAAILLFVPLYGRRNERWVEPARLSALTVRALTLDPPAPDAKGVVVFEDEPAPYATFDTALGALASAAVQVVTGRALEARIVTPAEPWTGQAAARYKLAAGRVERVE